MMVVMVVVITSRLRVRVPKLQDQEGTRAAVRRKRGEQEQGARWVARGKRQEERSEDEGGRRKGRAGTGDERQIYHPTHWFDEKQTKLQANKRGSNPMPPPSTQTGKAKMKKSKSHNHKGQRSTNTSSSYSSSTAATAAAFDK